MEEKICPFMNRVIAIVGPKKLKLSFEDEDIGFPSIPCQREKCMAYVKYLGCKLLEKNS